MVNSLKESKMRTLMQYVGVSYCFSNVYVPSQIVYPCATDSRQESSNIMCRTSVSVTTCLTAGLAVWFVLLQDRNINLLLRSRCLGLKIAF